MDKYGNHEIGNHEIGNHKKEKLTINYFYRKK